MSTSYSCADKQCYLRLNGISLMPFLCRYTIVSCVLLFFIPSSLTFVSSARSSGCFAFLLERNKFVDKTMFLKWVQTGDTSYITAPSRFGKTTSLDMVHRFYEIPTTINGSRIPKEVSENYIIFRKKYLHPKKNLAITREKIFFENKFGTRPVLLLNFKNLETDTLAGFIFDAGLMIRRAYDIVNFLANSNELTKGEKQRFKDLVKDNYENTAQILSNLNLLISALYKHFDNTKVLILIDELDAPVQRMLTAPIGPEQDAVIKCVQEIISGILQGHPHVWKGICVGIVKLSGILPFEAYNLRHEAFDANPDVALHFGSTSEEVTSLKEQYTNGNNSVEAAKKYYDGYRVQKADRSQVVNLFSTFSVKHYFETKELQGWTGVTGPPFLFELLRIKGVMNFVKEAILGYNITLSHKNCPAFDNFKLLRNTISVVEAQRGTEITLPLKHTNTVIEYFFELGHFTTVDSPVTDGPLKLRLPNREIWQQWTNIFVRWFQNYFNFNSHVSEPYEKYMTEVGERKQDHKNLSCCVADLFLHSANLPKNLDQFTGAALIFLLSEEDFPKFTFEAVPLPGQSRPDPSRLIFLRRNILTGKCTILVFSFTFNGNSLAALKHIAREDHKYKELREPSAECKGKHGSVLIGLNYSPREISSSILHNSIQIEQAKYYAARLETSSEVKECTENTKKKESIVTRITKKFKKIIHALSPKK